MKFVSIFFVLLLSACVSTEQTQPVSKAPATLSELLATGYQQLKDSSPDSALQTLLEAQQQCMEEHNTSDNKTFIHRTSEERFFYLLQASFEEVATSVESGPCAEISYLLGYTYLELDDINNAQRYVTKATEYSPVNAAYLSELAHIHQSNGEFQQAINLYRQAEDGAQNFSPSHLKQEELARAKRGIGFNLIELGKLDEAKTKFNEVLQVNPNDQKAKNELKYIESLEGLKPN
jgi:Tfp pilus assembly protein PilF